MKNLNTPIIGTEPGYGRMGKDAYLDTDRTTNLTYTFTWFGVPVFGYIYYIYEIYISSELKAFQKIQNLLD